MQKQEFIDSLIPDQKYTLTKIGVKNVDSRHFNLSDKTTGYVFLQGNNLIIGDSLIIAGVRTSTIISVSQNNENFVIETINSIYTLEPINESV